MARCCSLSSNGWIWLRSLSFARRAVMTRAGAPAPGGRVGRDRCRSKSLHHSHIKIMGITRLTSWEQAGQLALAALAKVGIHLSSSSEDPPSEGDVENRDPVPQNPAEPQQQPQSLQR